VIDERESFARDDEVVGQLLTGNRERAAEGDFLDPRQCRCSNLLLDSGRGHGQIIAGALLRIIRAVGSDQPDVDLPRRPNSTVVLMVSGQRHARAF